MDQYRIYQISQTCAFSLNKTTLQCITYNYVPWNLSNYVINKDIEKITLTLLWNLNLIVSLFDLFKFKFLKPLVTILLLTVPQLNISFLIMLDSTKSELEISDSLTVSCGFAKYFKKDRISFCGCKCSQ